MVALPGDSHVALLLRMTEKNQTTTLFVFTILFIDFLPYEVLCHCERSVAISRKGNRIVMTECVARMAKTTLKSCAFFGDDVFTAQVNFVINFTIFLRLSLVIKINRILPRVKIGGKSPLFFGNAVRISPF